VKWRIVMLWRRWRKKRCADCRIEIAPKQPQPGTWHWYMVWDEIWAQAGMSADGFLCVPCLERRLGRPLRINDLADRPVNARRDWADTPQLHRLKEQLATALAWRDM